MQTMTLALDQSSLQDLAYLIGGVGMLLEWRAYTLSCAQAFRRWSAIAAWVWAAQYLCLSAWTAAFTMATTALRTLLSSRLEQSRYRHLAAIGFIALLTALAAISWQGIISCLPAFAVINTTLALFYLSNRHMRIALLGSSVAWIANDIYWQAWPALLAESVAVLINMRTIWRLWHD